MDMEKINGKSKSRQRESWNTASWPTADLVNQPRVLTVLANLGQLGEKQGGRDLPVVRNLPINVTYQEASSSDILSQGSSSSSKPTEGENLKLVASKVGMLHLEMIKLYVSDRRKLKEAGATQGSTGGIQQLRHVAIPHTKTPKWPKSDGSTPIDTVNSSKKPKGFTGPGIYREALTNVRIAILKENYPQDRLSKEDQELILAKTMGILNNTQGRTPATQILQTGRGALMYVCADQWPCESLIQAINGHQPKAMNTKDLLKLVKMALRTRNNSPKILRSYSGGSRT
jgi:hypothetical protein